MNWLKKLMLRLAKSPTGSAGVPPPAGAPAVPPAEPLPASASPWDRLLAAVRAHDILAVRDLVSDDLGLLRATDDDGAAVLHHAALAGSVDVVRYLLECGAEAEAREGRRGARAIDWANEAGRTPVVRLLFSEGSSASLHEAAAYGLAQRVRDLLEDGAAELNTTAGFGTPLHHAVRWGHAEIVTLLLEAGADATARNADGHDAAALAERSPGDDETGGTVRVGSRRAELAAGRARCAQILAEHSARG